MTNLVEKPTAENPYRTGRWGTSVIELRSSLSNYQKSCGSEAFGNLKDVPPSAIAARSEQVFRPKAPAGKAPRIGHVRSLFPIGGDPLY